METCEARAVRRAAPAAAGLMVAFALSAAADTLIHAGALIDVDAGRVEENMTVRVRGDTIVGLEPGRSTAAGDDVVWDLTGSTVMPGWIDMHVHLGSELSPKSYEDRFRLGAVDNVLRSVEYARKTLLAGFTTVRDLGTNDGVAQALRDAIAGGWVDGPRVFTAGKSIATTGGHADPTNGVRAELRGDPGPAEGVINGVDDASKAVRMRYKEGSDLIKITATGGVLSQAKSGDNAQFTTAEIEAIVRAARDYGYKVAAHAHGPEGMKRAVLGGVDSVEHGTFMTEEIMRLMRRNGTYYVPTIAAGRFVAEKAEEAGYFSDLVRPKARAIGPQIQDTFARAYAAGVPIAFGTDTGVPPHGDNWREFVYMVEAGMPAMAAIRAATKNAAELLGEEARLGGLTAGKLADIVAVPGDPREDIGVMGRVTFVMKAGHVYKAPSR